MRMFDYIRTFLLVGLSLIGGVGVLVGIGGLFCWGMTTHPITTLITTLLIVTSFITYMVEES